LRSGLAVGAVGDLQCVTIRLLPCAAVHCGVLQCVAECSGPVVEAVGDLSFGWEQGGGSR